MRGHYLKERILLFLLELVRSEQLNTTASFLRGQTALVALEQFEDVIDHDSFQVDLLFVI